MPLAGKAVHIDEPFFIAIARQILRDPLRPLGFEFNWYGAAVPMESINNTPPVSLYALAAAWGLAGGREWLARLVLLPFDLAAACALYLIAARFLRAPLLPTLIVIASPSFWISMPHLFSEKISVAFGLWGVYGMARGVDDGSERWLWSSAGLLAAAALSKYAGVIYLAAALGYAWRRGLPPRRVLGLAAAGLAPLALLAAWDALSGRAAAHSAWFVVSRAMPGNAAEWAHKMRSFLAFTGGCAGAAMAWPALAWGRGRMASAAAIAAGLLALFAPALDLEPVRPLDRLTGLLFAGGASAGLWLLAAARDLPARGRALWGPWVLAGAAVQVLVYWAVLGRVVLFFLPPLVFFLAEALEAREGGSARVQAASLAAALVLGAGLNRVDWVYADSQRRFVHEAVRPLVESGRTVWFASHWGLQHYLEEAGARPLDSARGGWEAARPGDWIVASHVNPNMIPAFSRPLEKDHAIRLVRRQVVTCAIPLRLMSGWGGQAGFYASDWGFLPFAFSLEPLEEFRVGEHL